MRGRAILLAAALILAPLAAKAADLVVWWEKGFYPQADEAVQEIVAAFKQQTGKDVELVQPAQDEIMKQAASALQAGAAPDFLFSSVIETSAARWAYGDRLVDLDVYQASWLSRDRRVQVDDPAVRAGMVRAMGAYTDIWRKGCTPPDTVSWANIDNNKAFLAQTVVMTPNPTLSIPAALRTARPDDYYQNAATIDWPQAANGEPLVIAGRVDRAVVFTDGGHGVTAKQFVRYLAEWGLAHWATAMGDQYMPPMRKLVEQPFWLDPSDPHRMRAAIQIMTQPQLLDMDVRANQWRAGPIWEENVWGKAVHRVVTEGITPEQAVDEAIARIKEILAE